MSGPARLEEILQNKGVLPAAWRESVRHVHRGLFLPDNLEEANRRDEPEKWRRVVYGDLPLVTQVNNGRPVQEGEITYPTSSSSMPSIMLEMLDLLDVHDGQRVLEIGTGTGYNAALLCHRLGDQNVTSIEVDADVAAQAEKNLAAAGFHPKIIVGDGLAGDEGGGQYDRVIATCTVREIPPAWLRQAPEGRIVAPWGNAFFSGSFVALDVAPDEAQGRFSGSPAFMWLRSHRSTRAMRLSWSDSDQTGVTTHTHIDPRDLVADLDACFAVSTGVSGVSYREGYAQDGSDEVTLWLADEGSSWAAAEYVPGQSSYEVEQFGPRCLWDEASAAYVRWLELGSPERSQYGLTVLPDGTQQLWLGDPARVL